MTDTIEDQIHFMRAIEHLAVARLELHEACKRKEHDPLQYAFGAIDKAMHDIVLRVR